MGDFFRRWRSSCQHCFFLHSSSKRFHSRSQKWLLHPRLVITIPGLEFMTNAGNNRNLPLLLPELAGCLFIRAGQTSLFALAMDKIPFCKVENETASDKRKHEERKPEMATGTILVICSCYWSSIHQRGFQWLEWYRSGLIFFIPMLSRNQSDPSHHLLH